MSTEQLRSLFEDHYWDSLARVKDIVMLHVDAVLALHQRTGEAQPVTADKRSLQNVLLDHVDSDHQRGCQGRQYTCSCGYDAKTKTLLRGAADAIQSLSALHRQEWQPIETAPRDKWILVWRPASNVRDASWVCLPPSPGYWTEGRGGPLDPPPTHWMPLPAPPVIADKRGVK